MHKNETMPDMSNINGAENTESLSNRIIIKILAEMARFILGFTFMFSGFVKSIDPWGFAYKIEDYFTAFNLSSLSGFAFWISAILSALEFILGAFLVIGLYRKLSCLWLLIIMIFMTPLTLYLAIYNPISDCGCFGDAVTITNWETFYKNIVLLICAIFVYKHNQLLFNFFTGKFYWLVFYFIIIFALAFVVRNYIYEPIIDFRPYNIGTRVEDKMTVPEDKQEISEIRMIYSKNGVKQEFPIDDYPWNDSTWTYIDTKSHILHKGEEPAIKDFKINELEFDNSGTKIIDNKDITAQILNDSNYVFLIISPTLKNLNTEYLSNLEDVQYYAKEYKYKCYFLTSSGAGEILSFMKKNLVFFDFCQADERVLKTISRTNPSVLLLKDGVIYNKWADLEIPSEAQLNAPLSALDIGHKVDLKSKENRDLLYWCLLFFIPLFVVKIIDFILYNRKKNHNNLNSKKETK